LGEISYSNKLIKSCLFGFF